MPKSADALTQWLALNWERQERSYNPDTQRFLAALLGYPIDKVITEDRAGRGSSDVKLYTAEGIAWVVVELKINDDELLNTAKREALWQEKRKYVDGFTRYVLFLTRASLWIVTPDGAAVPGFETPLALRNETHETLAARLVFLRYETANYAAQWQEFSAGRLPYAYLKLDAPETLLALRGDLSDSFLKLTDAAALALDALKAEYEEFQRRKKELEAEQDWDKRLQKRALDRLNFEYRFSRQLFEDAISQFEEQYGRDMDSKSAQDQTRRIYEAFVADSAAALMARILFLRLVEDLGLQPRRISNGGPQKWADFVKELSGEAFPLTRIVSENMARIYRDPFQPTVFDWIHRANGELDKSLQLLILRLNAYDFAGLSEEILGDIYQKFLPMQKRKRLGEFYTPPSIVESILDKTARAHDAGRLLDPSCGSGSFLVRHTHWRLEDARRRGLNVGDISRDLQAETWGFDINHFASFISMFQMLWACLRFDPTGPAPYIEVHNVNSLSSDATLVEKLGEEPLAAGAKARDSAKWKYIVGNPPYIRAERVKYGDEMRRLWADVWGANADTGLVMLYRAFTEWLEPGGWFGMVVSGGYANSKTAGKVWKLLHPGQSMALRKIVWLEFTGKLWDANVIPMILIAERVPAKEDDEIELYVPQKWPDDAAPVKVKYADFFDPSINPRVSSAVALHGDYLLPLLEPGDVPLLRKLYPNGNGSAFKPLGDVAKWTYGIQRGGVSVTDAPTGTKPIQAIAGRSLAVAWGGEPAGWIDLDAVKARPFGKLSLWRTEPYPTQYIAIAAIALTLVAAVIDEAEIPCATLDTTVIAQSVNVNPKAIAAYLNSKMARFYWALRLRTAVLQGSSRATMYPRTFEAMPWPKTLTPEAEQALADGYDRLAALASIAKNSPNEWLLAETERRLAAGRQRITDRTLGLDLSGGVTEARIEELVLNENRFELIAGAAPQETFAAQTPTDTDAGLLAKFGSATLAEYVFQLLTLTTEEGGSVKAADIQALVIPRDYADLLTEYQQSMVLFRQVEQNFMAALEGMDAAVCAAFGLTPEEQDYITQRLNRFPLNRLQPRYPWQAARPRPIKAYMEDRFA